MIHSDRIRSHFGGVAPEPITIEQAIKAVKEIENSAMTTYTINPIEWREGKAIVSESIFIGMYVEYADGEVRAAFSLMNEQSKQFSTTDEAKDFIETSYKEFVEQFLEKHN